MPATPSALETGHSGAELEFAGSPEHAFHVWAKKTSLWWPRSHSISGAPKTVTFEPHPGGRIYERTAGGIEHDWGKVIAWGAASPAQLSVSHLRRPSRLTEVDITFSATGDGTFETIVHRGWERLGVAGPDLRKRNQAGWAGLLPHYEEACVAGVE